MMPIGCRGLLQRLAPRSAGFTHLQLSGQATGPANFKFIARICSL
jgi:hypothetical protein